MKIQPQWPLPNPWDHDLNKFKSYLPEDISTEVSAFLAYLVFEKILNIYIYILWVTPMVNGSAEKSSTTTTTIKTSITPSFFMRNFSVSKMLSLSMKICLYFDSSP